jgi:hypothetical protein
MSFPVHEIKHVKASHRKYQFLTILFTIVTLAATLGAAFSSIQLSNLIKESPDSKKMAEESTSPPKTPVIVDDSAMKEIEALKSELDREKSTSLKMKAKIKDLNNQISALKKAVVAPKPPKPKAAPAAQPKPKAAPVAQPKPKAAPVAQPEPTAPARPPQEKEPASKGTPPAPPQLPANQEVEPTPSPATGSPTGQEPSAPEPQQPVSPKPAPAAPTPEVPANNTGAPSGNAAEEPAPKPESEQPLTAPPVTVPSGQPQSEDLPSKTGDEQPDSKINP